MRTSHPLLLALLVAVARAAASVAPASLARSALPRAAVRLGPKKPAAAAGGFGKKPATPTGPTAGELLKQSSKAYELLESIVSAGDEQTPVTKYSIVLRAEGVAELSDWVPVAWLALHCPGVSSPAALVPGALAAARREILEAGGQVVPKLRTAPRDRIEFGFEPLASFEANVYNSLAKRSDRRADAAKTLGVEPGASAAEVKKAHRKLVMELHPDRFVGDEAGAAGALDQMLQVTEAYDELGGGRGQSVGAGSGKALSWYESLGGKMRVSFSALGPLGKDGADEWTGQADASQWHLGVHAVEAELAMDFVARNVLRAAGAASSAAAEKEGVAA